MTFIVGETVRLTCHVPLGNGASWWHAGELVRILQQEGDRYLVADRSGRQARVLRTALQADHTLPLFDEYHPETTGCLF